MVKYQFLRFENKCQDESNCFKMVWKIRGWRGRNCQGQSLRNYLVE